MIGPWTITIGETTQKFSALTMIDTVTNLVEVVRVSNKTSAHIALQFKKKPGCQDIPNLSQSHTTKEESL
jgi:hypothetical protein